DRRTVADAEPEDCQRNPGERGDRPHDLHQRRERQSAAAIPGERDPQGNADPGREQVTPGHPEERSDDVLEQETFLRELSDRAGDRHRPREKGHVAESYCEVPRDEKREESRERREAISLSRGSRNRLPGLMVQASRSLAG